MARSNIFFALLAGAVILFALMIVHSSVKGRIEADAMTRKSMMVRELGLTDLCLFCDARYARHLSQTDLHAPFQDGPMTFEHFPSGSILDARALGITRSTNAMTGWIEKQRKMVDFTLASLMRRKAKAASLALIYTTLVFILASLAFFTGSLKREATSVLKDAPEVVVQRLVAGRHEMVPVSYVARLTGIKGVTSVKPRLWGYYYFPSTGANYTIIAPDRFGHGSGSIVIGKGMARISLAAKGDVLSFKGADGGVYEFKIVGTLSDESEIVSSDLMLMSGADFRRLFSVPETHATDIALSVRNTRELETIAEKVTDLLPDTRAITREQILRTYDAVFSWRQGIVIAMVSCALLALLILAWEKASGLSADERRETGILKALGWDISDVILVKFWEGVTVSLSSFLAGTMLAYVHVYFASAVLFEPVLKGWSTLYPKFTLTPHVDAHELLALFALTVVPYTVATIVPSWRAAIVDPDAQVR